MTHTLSHLLILAGALLASCQKEPLRNTVPAQPQPQTGPAMVYTDLNNREVKYQQSGAALDVNTDGRADLFFGVRLIGDALNAVDKRQYFVLSNLSTALPVNINEQVMPLNTNDIIPLSNFNGSNWYSASEIVLMERNEFANGAVVWRGNWLDKQRKYLPFQLLQNNQRHNGWIELTAAKTGERLVLHRMAISKEAEKEVKAGG